MRRPRDTLRGALRRLRRAAAAGPFFDPAWYGARYRGGAASGRLARLHYLLHGRTQAREPVPPETALYEADLWSGVPEGGRGRIEALARDGTGWERIHAAWALARWHAARQEWSAAGEALRALSAVRGWRHAVPGAGPDLLAARAFARAGAMAEARAALRALPRTADRAVAEADLAQAQGAGPEAMLAALSGALGRAGLERLSLAEGPGAPFDRLAAEGPRAAPRIPPDAPLVSVVVPARDAAETLGTALGALGAQTWRALEILVIENGSRDGTLEVAEAHAARDPRIRVLRSQERGAYAARNLGLAEARGRYVTVHDADDWSHPRKIEAQMRPHLGPRPPAATVSHWMRLTPDLALWVWRQEDGFVHRNVSSVLLRADLRDTVGYWDRVAVNADTEFYYRLLARFGGRAVEEVRPGLPLAFARAVEGSLTRHAETHIATQIWGPRRAYHEAALRWHRSAPAEALGLPRHPVRRAFPAPAAMLLDEPSASRAAPPSGRGGGLPAAGRAAGARGAGRARETREGIVAPALRHALLTLTRPAIATALAPIPGRLADAGGERALVCGHQAEPLLFGAERSLLDLLDRLAAEGRAPVAVLPQALNEAYLDDVLARAAALCIVPYEWWREGRAAHPVTLAALRRIIRETGAAEVHVNTLTIDAPLLAARAEAVPGVMHVHELPASDPALCRTLDATPEAIRARILKAADRFVAISPLVAEWLDAPGRVRVRGNAVDRALFGLAPPRPAPGTPIRVALVSSMIAKKGIADAVALARRLGGEIELRLIGPMTRDLRALGRLPPNVRHLGYVASPVEAMAQGDVILSLSRFEESFGRTVLEGMAAARPVVCYDWGMPPRLVADGQTGFVVPRGDVAAAADAVARLARDPARLLAMGMAGRGRARRLMAEWDAPPEASRPGAVAPEPMAAAGGAA